MAKVKPTDAELQILEVLWRLGPQTVRQVNDVINEEQAATGKQTGYTTTLKLMQIMTEKGLVDRDASQRKHIYEASLSQEEVRGNLLSAFVQSTFGGSATSLVMQALGNHKTSKEELKAIKKLIADLEKK